MFLLHIFWNLVTHLFLTTESRTGSGFEGYFLPCYTFTPQGYIYFAEYKKSFLYTRKNACKNV